MAPDNKKNDNNGEQWFLPEDTRKQLVQILEQLQNPVHLVVVADPKADAYGEYLTGLCHDMERLGDKVQVEFVAPDSDRAKELGVEHAPAVLLEPEKYHIRFTGAPLGEEGRAFITALVLMSSGTTGLSEVSESVLEELDEERRVRVFTSPTCPYCPGQALNAIKCALAKPDLVHVETVDMAEFQDLAEKHNVGSVPHTFINDKHEALGLMPEERFALELVHLKSAEELSDEQQAAARAAGMGDVGSGAAGVEDVDLVIVGAGPAGLTAGIYAERSGMKTVILEKGVLGGQVSVTPVVENYPAFARVAGKQLMDIMAQHSREYCDIIEGVEVTEIKIGKHVEVLTTRTGYRAKAVILATGAAYRHLGVPGEQEYGGAGVNYCASCDGYMYQGKKVAVVGGGNTALTDALHLKNLGADVTLIHRRGELRAEQRLQDSLVREDVPVIWDTVVEEILGKDGKMTALKLKNVDTEETSELELDGVFIAIGHVAHTELAQQVGLHLEHGFVKVNRAMRTNIPRVYAAGDLTGGVQQIVTAIGEGAAAALSAFQDTANPYWKED